MAEKSGTDKALDVASKAPLPPQAKAAVQAAKVLKDAKNFWSIARDFLWGNYEKRASNLSMMFMLATAAILDLFSIIPVVGDITMIVAVCIFFPWFLILHYRFQRNIVKKFSINILAPIVEAIPAISAFPAILGAVGFNLFQMRFEDYLKYKENEEKRLKEKEAQDAERARIQESILLENQKREAEFLEIQSELESQADEERAELEEEEAQDQEDEEAQEIKSASFRPYLVRDIVPSPPAQSSKTSAPNPPKTNNGEISGSNQPRKVA